MVIEVPPPPFAQPPKGIGIPYQIFRQPVRSADEPVTLPAGAIVDLGFSGIGNGTHFGIATPFMKQIGIDKALTAVPSVPVPGVSQPVAKPVAIMFGPSGKLESVYYAHLTPPSSQPVFTRFEVITPLYLLVGQPPNADTTSPPNFMNTDNIWVTVNPQTGLVTPGEVGTGADYWQKYGVTAPQLNDYFGWPNDVPRTRAAAIPDSRAFARSQQNMGGR
jgi:hypothetical protein